jgi:hypothetical protein
LVTATTPVISAHAFWLAIFAFFTGFSPRPKPARASAVFLSNNGNPDQHEFYLNAEPLSRAMKLYSPQNDRR